MESKIISLAKKIDRGSTSTVLFLEKIIKKIFLWTVLAIVMIFVLTIVSAVIVFTWREARNVYAITLHAMTIIEIALSIFFILLLLCGTGFIWWAYRQKYPKRFKGVRSENNTRLPWLQRAHNWLGENRIFTFLLFPLFHFDGLLLCNVVSPPPNWWWVHMINNWNMIGLQGVLLLFSWMIPWGKIPLHHKFGKIGAYITGLIMLINVVWYIGNFDKPRATATALAPPATAQASSLPSLRAPLNDEMAIRKLLEAKLGNTEEGKRAQWELIQIAKRENLFKQWDPDGKVVHGDAPPKGNPHDTCAFMINTDKQAKVVAKHDLNTLEGCVDAAIEIYQESKRVNNGDGTKPWSLSKNNQAVETGVKFFIAPVDKQSEQIATGLGATLRPDGWIEITTDKGQTYELGKPGVTGSVFLPKSLWVKVQSKMKEAVYVAVIP